ncbi:MAG TPA: D-glycero-beta-D-manno-heptose 1-phosphate adenylyltransferase [Chloroflexota bacterium]|nr:D-glycero-beta-D-manno-heptose 1-phosphate adenylyltransferase [Chloroflexota bacterium]
MPALVDVVRRFRRLRTLAIGDVMLDSYLEGTAARLCAEGPVPVVRKTAEQRAPGGAANTAANLRALGAEVDLLGLVGRDAAGALLRAALRERGVDPRWLVEDDRASTLHKLRILADGQYVVRFDEGETRCCADAAEARLLAHLEETYLRCDVVVVSDYRYGVLSDGLLARLRALRAARPRALLVDSKALGRFAAAGATVVTPNHHEAQLLVEPSGDAPTERPALPAMERLGRRLLEAVDAECAAITLGADGVCLVPRGGDVVHLPAHPVARANDVGAGDSFAAAMALALGAGAGPADAARIGIEAAAVAVTRPRTAIVAHQDLLRRVSLHAHAEAPGGREALARLAARLDGARAAGRRIVFTNGVFDILHAGHVEFLRQAKALGDVLVVGVNTDRGARRLKGERRPINPEGDRLALVAALDAVDHAVLFDEDTPARLIRALRPHVHVKGGDYAEAPLPEAEAVHAVGGQVVILPLVGSLSTTAVIDRIVARVGDGAAGGAP